MYSDLEGGWSGTLPPLPKRSEKKVQDVDIFARATYRLLYKNIYFKISQSDETLMLI